MKNKNMKRGAMVEKLALAICQKHGTLLVLFSDILFLEANGSYTKVYFINQSMPHIVHSEMLCHPIGYYEAQLPAGFVRVHRSFVVNLAHARWLDDCGNIQFRLADSVKAGISKRMKVNLKQAVVF